MKIGVLLSTYNGASYIREFLDSLLNQSYKNFTVLVRDDGSTDDTLSILDEYKAYFNERMHVLDAVEGNLGPSQSFRVLLNKIDADYVLFADQDDVWMPNKIQRLYDVLVQQERLYPDAPILVQCDLEVVDERLNTLAKSFWRFQGLDTSRNSLPNLLIQNTITGCAVMINRKLVALSRDVPDLAIMHDWWVGLVAAAFGRIVSVPEALVRYRQHGLNSVGAKKYGFSYFRERAFEMMLKRDFSMTRRSIDDSRTQASAFLDKYSSSLNKKDKVLLQKFIRLNSMSWFGRRYFLFKNGMVKHGLMRNFALFLFV